MRNTPYEILRERLRQHYNYERDVGSKPRKEDDCVEIADLKSSESFSESEFGEV